MTKANGEMKMFLLVVLVMVLGISQAKNWTVWFNHDNPDGIGDFERILNKPGTYNWDPCGGREREMIHVKLDGENDNYGIKTRDSLVVGPNFGLSCDNGFFGGPCQDYAVKYIGSYPSSWNDADDPPKDDERKFRHGALPGNILFIRFKIQGSTNYDSIHQKIKLSPRDGFSCLNADQSNGECDDYEVRYYCGDYPHLPQKPSA